MIVIHFAGKLGNLLIFIRYTTWNSNPCTLHHISIMISPTILWYGYQQQQCTLVAPTISVLQLPEFLEIAFAPPVAIIYARLDRLPLQSCCRVHGEEADGSASQPREGAEKAAKFRQRGSSLKRPDEKRRPGGDWRAAVQD